MIRRLTARAKHIAGSVSATHARRIAGYGRSRRRRTGSAALDSVGRRLSPVLLGMGLAAALLATITALIAATPGDQADPTGGIEDRAMVAELHNISLRMRDQVLKLRRDGDSDAAVLYRRLAAESVDIRDRLRLRLTGLPAREALTTLDEAMESHRRAFGELERVIAVIGASPVEGLNGTVVAAANVLEQSIASIDRDDLMVWFLLMRLHEREFLLSGNTDLVGRVQEAGLNINFEIARADMPDARRTAVLQRLTDYTNAVASLSDAIQRRRTALAQLGLHGERMVEPFDFLANHTDRALRLTMQEAAETSGRAASIAWIAALLGAIACLALALRIAIGPAPEPTAAGLPGADGDGSDDDAGLEADFDADGTDEDPPADGGPLVPVGGRAAEVPHARRLSVRMPPQTIALPPEPGQSPPEPDDTPLIAPSDPTDRGSGQDRS